MTVTAPAGTDRDRARPRLACGRRRRRRPRARVGVARAGQPGDDRVGDRRATATELAAYCPLARARRGGGEVALGRPVAGQPGAAGARGRRRACSTASGCRAPGSRPGSTTTSRRCRRSGARCVVSIWGAAGRRLRRAAERLAAVASTRPALHRGARGQRELPQRRGPVADVRPLGRRPPPRRVTAATACPALPRWAKLSPNVPDLAEIARRRSPAGPTALTLVNTLLGHGHRHRVGAGLCSGAGGGGLSGPRRAPRGGPGRVGVPDGLPRRADHRRRRGDVAVATPSSC